MHMCVRMWVFPKMEVQGDRCLNTGMFRGYVSAYASGMFRKGTAPASYASSNLICGNTHICTYVHVSLSAYLSSYLSIYPSIYQGALEGVWDSFGLIEGSRLSIIMIIGGCTAFFMSWGVLLVGVLVSALLFGVYIKAHVFWKLSHVCICAYTHGHVCICI